MGAIRHLPVQTFWKGALECMWVGDGWGGITSFSQAFLFLDPPRSLPHGFQISTPLHHCPLLTNKR